MAPLIGITTYGQNDERHFTLPREYVDSVRRAGGIALLITPGETAFDRLLSELDGIILAGGGDIAPACYGGGAHDTIHQVDEERDATELEFARAVVARGLPTFGICRGMQLLNVAFGGTLYEHLPDVVGETVTHRKPPREPTEHEVDVAVDSRLAAIIGGGRCPSVSWHHQAIHHVADRFTVAARADDGIIEAIESPGNAWLFGVQWHPELSAADDERQQRLFDAFVAAAGQSKRT